MQDLRLEYNHLKQKNCRPVLKLTVKKTAPEGAVFFTGYLPSDFSHFLQNQLGNFFFGSDFYFPDEFFFGFQSFIVVVG